MGKKQTVHPKNIDNGDHVISSHYFDYDLTMKWKETPFAMVHRVSLNCNIRLSCVFLSQRSYEDLKGPSNSILFVNFRRGCEEMGKEMLQESSDNIWSFSISLLL